MDHKLIAYLTARSVILPDSEGGCYLWQQFRTKGGYGMFHRKGRTYYVHREAMKAHGYDVEGLSCDHLCVNKNCWNPLHIELVTVAENTSRAANKRWGVYRRLANLRDGEAA